MNNNFSKYRAGFSLVEVLFSLTVLSVGVASVAVLMTSNIKNSITAKNQVIASQLAQEGVELVKNIKDNQDLTALRFTADMQTGNDYRVDFDSNYATFKGSGTVSSGFDNKQLFLKLNGGIFMHESAMTPTPTKFYRKISVTVTPPAPPVTTTGSAEVTSYVIWGGTEFPTTCNTANKCVKIISILPDVQ